MATDATLRIKIGVSVDADASRVFEPIERASARARKRVKENLDAATSAVKKPTPSGDDPYRETARKAVASAQMRVAAEAAASAQISAIRKREAAEADADRRKTVTAALNAAKAIASAAGNAAGRGAKFAKDVGAEGGSSAYRALPGAVRFGRQVAGDLARGAGLNLDPVAAMQKSIGLEKKSVDLSNAGFMAGAEGPAGVRQDPKAILEGVRSAATAAALDVGSATEGLQAFVSKTGDLDTGRAVLGDLGKLARATGTDFGDMVSAAGDVATQLDDVGDKSQRIEKLNAIMRTVAGQGKLGAVEIKDLAVQMAKLSAVAPQFSGSFEENMGEMGALVQMARAKGGASSAPQAATSLGSFVSTLSKSARTKEFAARGIKLDDDKTGKLRSAEDIIVDSLNATKGNRGAMNKLFMDAGAKRIVGGFQTVYNDAEAENRKLDPKDKRRLGEGLAGEQAVRKEFYRLRSASMGKGEINDSFNASMNTTEAKAQKFQNQVDKIVSTLADRFIPAMDQAAPKIIEFVTAVSDGVGKLMGAVGSFENVSMGTIIAAAITADIARAGISGAINAAMQKSMGGAAAGLILTGAMVTITASSFMLEDDKKNDDNTKGGLDQMLAKAQEATGKLQNANIEVAAAEFDAEHADENDPMAKESAEFRLAAARKKQLDAKHEVDTAQEGITEKLGQYTKFKAEGLGADGTNNPGARLTAVAWMSDFRQGLTGSKSGFGRDELHSATAVAEKLDAVIAANKAMTAALTAGLKITSLPNGLPGMPPGSVTKDGDNH